MLFLCGQISLHCVTNAKYFFPPPRSVDNDEGHVIDISPVLTVMGSIIDISVHSSWRWWRRQICRYSAIGIFSGTFGYVWMSREMLRTERGWNTATKNNRDTSAYACLRYWKPLRSLETGEAVGNDKILREINTESQGNWRAWHLLPWSRLGRWWIEIKPRISETTECKCKWYHNT
jgi:hypothetical protein